MADLAEVIARGTDQMSGAYAGLARVRAANRDRQQATLTAATESLGEATKAWRQYGSWQDAKAAEADSKAALEAARLGRVKGGDAGELTALDGYKPSTLAGYEVATKRRDAAQKRAEVAGEAKLREVEATHYEAQTADLKEKARVRAKQEVARATLGAREQRSSVLPGYQPDPIDQEQFFVQQGVEVPDDVASAAKEQRLANRDAARTQHERDQIDVEIQKADARAQEKADKADADFQEHATQRAHETTQHEMDRGLKRDQMKVEAQWRQAQIDVQANQGVEGEYAHDLEAHKTALSAWQGAMNGRREALRGRAVNAKAEIDANDRRAAVARASSQPDGEFVRRADKAQTVLDAVEKEYADLEAEQPPALAKPTRGAKRPVQRIGEPAGGGAPAIGPVPTHLQGEVDSLSDADKARLAELLK